MGIVSSSDTLSTLLLWKSRKSKGAYYYWADVKQRLTAHVSRQLLSKPSSALDVLLKIYEGLGGHLRVKYRKPQKACKGRRPRRINNG